MRMTEKLRKVARANIEHHLALIRKGSTFYDTIPMSTFKLALEQVGIVMIDEDGSPLSDLILLGERSHATISLADAELNILNRVLWIDWCRMDGRYDINWYIS